MDCSPLLIWKKIRVILRHFLTPNQFKIQSPNAIFYPATKPIINQALIKLKFTFSEKATKIGKIFTVNLTVCSNRQIDDEDFVNFCGLLRKYELYQWISTFDPVLFPKKFEKWALLTPPDKAGHQTWRSIILWNMTMMRDYWINVYFVLQYLLCLFLIEYYEIVSKSRLAFFGEGNSW